MPKYLIHPIDPIGSDSEIYEAKNASEALDMMARAKGKTALAVTEPRLTAASLNGDGAW